MARKYNEAISQTGKDGLSVRQCRLLPPSSFQPAWKDRNDGIKYEIFKTLWLMKFWHFFFIDFIVYSMWCETR